LEKRRVLSHGRNQKLKVHCCHYFVPFFAGGQQPKLTSDGPQRQRLWRHDLSLERAEAPTHQQSENHDENSQQKFKSSESPAAFDGPYFRGD
jgi:hypothetical protein